MITKGIMYIVYNNLRMIVSDRLILMYLRDIDGA